MLYKGTMALEMWCRRVCEGYPGVEIKNMDESWRDGLAFCAILHRYRPDLIAWQECRKGDTARNCSLAFGVAESSLDIPALLDTQDMLNTNRLDRLSILTYLSEMYHVLEGNSVQVSGHRKKVSAENVVEADSLYSSASSGSVSPGREMHGSEASDTNEDMVDISEKEEIRKVDEEDATLDSPPEYAGENECKVKHVRRRQKKSLASLVNRRLVKSMHEIPIIELTENEESAFSLGFKKFSSLAKSSDQVCHQTTTRTREELDNKPSITTEIQSYSVMTQTEQLQDNRVTVFTQTERDNRAATTQSCQYSQSNNNINTFATHQYSIPRQYNTCHRHEYNTSQAIIQQYNTAHTKHNTEQYRTRCYKYNTKYHQRYSQYDTLV